MQVKTKEEIVRETVAFYGADPKGRRATYSHGTCCNFTDDGRMCAFARCTTNPRQLEAGSVGSVYVDSEDVMEVLKPEYRVGDRAFWQDVQHLHDSATHWNETGLSDLGYEYVLRTFNINLKEAP